MQSTVNDPPPASAHPRNLSTPQASADPRDFLEDGPSISYDVLPTTSLMRTRMDVRPFNPDSEAWNTWFAHFQEAASNNGWSAADRCQRLQALVQGKAVSLSLPSPVNNGPTRNVSSASVPPMPPAKGRTNG